MFKRIFRALRGNSSDFVPQRPDRDAMVQKVARAIRPVDSLDGWATSDLWERFGDTTHIASLLGFLYPQFEPGDAANARQRAIEETRDSARARTELADRAKVIADRVEGGRLLGALTEDEKFTAGLSARMNALDVQVELDLRGERDPAFGPIT